MLCLPKTTASVYKYKIIMNGGNIGKHAGITSLQPCKSFSYISIYAEPKRFWIYAEPKSIQRAYK
ncbi:hypothetical protein JHK82_038185 [Glycine max]|nr:hypothetical protein JHK87_038140 [Glycine soja]KAG5114916.1 hypothetical protein JHK82_038185 [Glycine max]KAG5132197.1 hypothetical protein JHK84_038594 [Glycine max]KHN30027.1 hypothetical protein glysoja_010405 [Glycine soja]